MRLAYTAHADKITDKLLSGAGNMIGIVAKLTVAAGKEAEFEAAASALMAKVNANEPGVITYQLYKSKSDAQVYIFMEQYADQAAVDAHGKTDYFLAAQPVLGPLLAAMPDVQYFDSVG
jgi:quinol monooxygenase YgiN